MAHATQKGLNTSAAGSERVLYWMYQFLAAWLPANFPGRLALVASGNGGGDWSGEAGPLDNSYLVIQPTAFPWSDGKSWQLLIAARHTAGASTVGGVGGAIAITGPGLWVGFARDGGWNDTTKTFGTSLFGGLSHVLGTGGGNLSACNFALCCYERLNGITPDGVDFLFWMDNAKDGSWDGSVNAGHSRWFDTTDTKPHQFFAGKPDPLNAASKWGSNGAGVSYCVNTAGVGHDLIATSWDTIWDTKMLVDGTGDWAASALVFFNWTTGAAKGWVQGVLRHQSATANGTEDSTHSWVCYNGLLFPTQNP